jgi:hypothetical protein
MIGLKSTVVCSSLLCAAIFVACTSDDSQSSSGGSTTATTSTSTSAGTGGGTTSSSSATTGTGGGGPIVCTDVYSNITPGECDLLQQDCGAGMTCRPAQVEANVWSTHCVAGGGLKGPASPCTSNNECEAGLFCIGPEDLAQCIPVCCPGTDEPCGSGNCNLTVSYGTQGKFVMMCSYSPECTLLTMNACPGGGECHIQELGLAACVPPSAQQVDEGGPCMFINDCKDMQFCGPGDVCRYHCFVSGSDQPPGLGGCPAGQVCNNLDFGIPDIGLCEPM